MEDWAEEEAEQRAHDYRMARRENLDAFVAGLKKLVHGWRENVLEMEMDPENWRNRDYREMLLGNAQEVDDLITAYEKGK